MEENVADCKDVVTTAPAVANGPLHPGCGPSDSGASVVAGAAGDAS